MSEIGKLHQVKGKHWYFTFNNVEMEGAVRNDTRFWEPATWFDKDRYPSYAVWQLERGEQGTFHFQGYVTFPMRVSLAYLKKWLVGHWTRCDGNHSECIKYCTKDETYVDGPWFIGNEPEAPQRGKRSDILRLRDEIADGKSDKDLIEDDTVAPAFARYPKFVSAVRVALGGGDRTEQTNCIILWGPPSTGKTTKAHEIADELGYSVYTVPHKVNEQSMYWNDYVGQEAVLVDEVSGSTFTGELFCKLLDRFQLTLPAKFGYVNFRAKLLLLTSNKDPRTWWSPAVLEKNPGILRRLREPITKVYKFEQPVHGPVGVVFPQKILELSALKDAQVDVIGEPQPEYVNDEPPSAGVRLSSFNPVNLGEWRDRQRAIQRGATAEITTGYYVPTEAQDRRFTNKQYGENGDGHDAVYGMRMENAARIFATDGSHDYNADDDDDTPLANLQATLAKK